MLQHIVNVVYYCTDQSKYYCCDMFSISQILWSVIRKLLAYKLQREKN